MKESGANDKESLKKSWFSRVVSFFQHPVTVRIIALAAAAVMVGISGGALIPLITLVSTFVTSLFSIVGEVFHRRSLEKARLYGNLIDKVDKSYDSLEPLKLRNKKVFAALEKAGGPLEKSNKPQKPVERASNTRIAGRVIRDLGLESFWTVALFGTATNPVGAIGYAISLILGITKVSKEYNSRVQDEIAKEELKRNIQEKCIKMSLENKNYKDSSEIYKQYQECLIQHQALREICALSNINAMKDEEITKKYHEAKQRVAQHMKFAPLPREISFLTNLANAMNPLKPTKIELFQEAHADLSYSYAPPESKKKGGVDLRKLGGIAPTTAHHQVDHAGLSK